MVSTRLNSHGVRFWVSERRHRPHQWHARLALGDGARWWQDAPASCINPCPPHGIGEMITTNMEPGKEYLTTCCMPEFASWGTYAVPHWEYQPGSRNSIPSPWGAPAPCTINLWKFVPSQFRYGNEWKVIHTWSPYTTPGVAVSELWFQCEPCER